MKSKRKGIAIEYNGLNTNIRNDVSKYDCVGRAMLNVVSSKLTTVFSYVRTNVFSSTFLPFSLVKLDTVSDIFGMTVGESTDAATAANAMNNWNTINEN